MIPNFKFLLEQGATAEYLPTQGEPQATGYDVRAFITAPITLKAFEKAVIPLGFKVFSPEGWWLALETRSSTYVKFDLNSLDGIIDTAYEGSVRFACQYLPASPQVGYQITITPGQRLGQLVPFKRQEMTVEAVTEEEFQRLCQERGAARGSGGFGSTGS